MMSPLLMSETTIPEHSETTQVVPAPSISLVLVVAWCGDEPWRAGEVLLVPRGSGNRETWFGRGPASAGQPPKSPLGQLRPGQWRPSPPLGTPAISRYQLAIEAIDGARLVLRNAGRCPLLVNETAVDRAEIVAGDRVQLGRQLLFLCAPRAVEHPPVPPAMPPFAFGGADAHGIVGESAAAWELRRQIATVAAQEGHVLVTGASGSGKELVAQAIHARSSRASRALVARNAATLPESLIDAELFGNARNYPNPGMPERKGLVGEADGSTLFLDELAELPHSAQAHLLRVLDAGEYQRLGETQARTSDFRLIAATNRELSSFKHDLLARLMFHIAVPGLDARKDDLPLLVRHVLSGTGGEGSVSLELMRRLIQHSYQTGVRELRSLLWRAILKPDEPDDETAGAETGDDPDPASPPAEDLGAPPGLPSAEEVRRCLDEHNGVIEQAWRSLGLKNRFSLYRLIRRYELEVRRRPTRP
jgi:two-component system nitrogen regulation response regulator GlnG/two-component system response regulator HydG